ncbi:MAG: hypothetical protein GXP38_06940 [Chloroflexi bacterium]|nr:hypothetical protein [Chloroflexota bacterium]
MKRLLYSVLSGLGLATVLSLLLPTIVSAQGGGDETAGAAMLCLVVLVILAINIAILVWVIKDAQARGTSAGAWTIIVILFGIFGLLAYLIARPKGRLVPCPECGRRKPITDVICPHCGKRVA